MAVNIKGKEPDAEKFKEKSKTNKIQYFSTEQSIQAMLGTGMERQILAQNMMASYEVDKNDIDIKGVQTNDYRADKFDIVEQGRRADETIRAEITASDEAKRQANSKKNNASD